MDRRMALGAMALAAASALGAGIVVGEQPQPVPPPPLPPKKFGVPRAYPRPVRAAYPLPAHFTPPSLARIRLPGGSLYSLPGSGNLVALTVDDGNDTDVVAAYAKYCAESGLRVTFFVNGKRPSWTDNVAALRPLVESGQVQLGNHTWSHPNLLNASTDQIVDELQRNDDFIRKTYGVEARPYFRPPYGNYDDRVAAAAASVGYTVPVLWYGSLSDSTLLGDAQLLEAATRWILPQHIVIGHANYPTITRHFGKVAAIMRARALVPVTLDDVFTRS